MRTASMPNTVRGRSVGKKANRRDQPVTMARLQAALILISQVIVEDGPACAPYLERMEREIDEMRQQNDPVARARQYLAAHGSEYLGIAKASDRAMISDDRIRSEAMFEVGKSYVFYTIEGGDESSSSWQVTSVDMPLIKIRNGYSPDRIVNTSSPMFIRAEPSKHDATKIPTIDIKIPAT